MHLSIRAEFFMEKTTTAIYNSEGIDVSYEKSSVNGEFVVQCITPQDVEQYQEFAYDDLDTEALDGTGKRSIGTGMRQGKGDRKHRKKETISSLLSEKMCAH